MHTNQTWDFIRNGLVYSHVFLLELAGLVSVEAFIQPCQSHKINGNLV